MTSESSLCPVATNSESDSALYATSFTLSPFGGVYVSRASSRPVRTSNARTALKSARNSWCAAAPPHSPERNTFVSFGRRSASGGMLRERDRSAMTRRAARTCQLSLLRTHNTVHLHTTHASIVHMQTRTMYSYSCILQ